MRIAAYILHARLHKQPAQRARHKTASNVVAKANHVMNQKNGSNSSEAIWQKKYMACHKTFLMLLEFFSAASSQKNIKSWRGVDEASCDFIRQNGGVMLIDIEGLKSLNGIPPEMKLNDAYIIVSLSNVLHIGRRETFQDFRLERQASSGSLWRGIKRVIIKKIRRSVKCTA